MKYEPEAPDLFILRAALDNLDHGLLIIDRLNSITFANKFLLEKSGYRNKELAGLNISEIVRTENKTDSAGTLLKRSGRKETVSIKSKLLKNGFRQIELSFSSAKSIEQEIRMDLIIKNMPVIPYTTTIGAGIESIHIHTDEFLGYSRDEFSIESFRWMDIIHPEDREAVAANAKACIEGVKTDIDYRFRAKDGSWHWMLDRGRMFDAENGKRVIYGALIDLTKRKNIENQLKETLKEKEILMKEINHRVKNNLLMISSIISLKEADSGEDLSDISRQIDAIRIVHEKLYQSENITEINISEYSDDLIHTISGSFFDYPVSFINEIPDIMIPTKKLIPLGLIINELATNAIKHGFSAGTKSEIAMSMEKKAEGWYVLTFSNSGKPIPDDIDLNNPKTLGLRLLQALMSQISGYLEVIRKPHPVFTITFRIN